MVWPRAWWSKSADGQGCRRAHSKWLKARKVHARKMGAGGKGSCSTLSPGPLCTDGEGLLCSGVCVEGCQLGVPGDARGLAYTHSSSMYSRSVRGVPATPVRLVIAQQVAGGVLTGT